MPIISKIGTKSWNVRLVYTAIYAALIFGAFTMIYPFMLMIAGAFTSETDYLNITPYPRFWFDDRVLYQKYCESKYNVDLATASYARKQYIGSWRKINMTNITNPQQSTILHDYLDWRNSDSIQPEWFALGHIRGGKLQPINAREFRNEMMKKFHNNIHAYTQATGAYAQNWAAVTLPADSGGASRRIIKLSDYFENILRDFKMSRPVEDRIIFNLDGIFWWTCLIPKYTSDIREYNRLHGTHFQSYDDVYLTPRAPKNVLARQDWEEFVRYELNLNFIRLDHSLAPAWHKFLVNHYHSIDKLNIRFNTKYDSFDKVTFPTVKPNNPSELEDWELFLKDKSLCHTENIEIFGPRQSFEAFVAKKRNIPISKISPIPLPIELADIHDTLANAKKLRWEFSTRNFKQVLDHLIFHGRGLTNTIIYCSLAILTSLLVNPLAAYALSRYRPPSTYKILLFCMATMAFPGEVTMIPGFLLLKRFPLWQLALAALFFIITFSLTTKFRPEWSEKKRTMPALGIGLFLGFYLLPGYLGFSNVSLLNTFSALILPGMANGYFIFLLKGFFDSLPQELYESADLDGAGEWRKFWAISMSLSKPILAVIALGAFTSAYTAFMMALIIIPDPDMWTIMVWLFQLEQSAHQSVVYASLVIAAIPTFLVFVCCQNIIMRGIIVPVEK
jgi:multiple sugar transport system permease protein